MFNSNPSTTEIISFIRQLEAYSKSKTSIASFIHEAAIDTENPKFKKVLLQMHYDIVEDGKSLSDAFAKADIFPGFCAATIAAGEATNNLATALRSVISYLKMESNVSKKIKAAMLPIYLVATMLCACFSLYVWAIVPKYERMYAQRKAELPWLTKTVFSNIHDLKEHWYIVVLLMIALYFLWRWFSQTYPSKVDKLKIKLPFYGPMYFFILQFRLSNTFSTLFKTGMKSIEVLEYSSRVIDNRVYAKILRTAAQELRMEGKNFSAALKKADPDKFLSKMLINFITTGEENNCLSTQLDTCKITFQEEVDDKTERFKILFSAALLLPGAIAIGFLYIIAYIPTIGLFSRIGG